MLTRSIKLWRISAVIIVAYFFSSCESNKVINTSAAVDSTTTVIVDTIPAADYNSEVHPEAFPEEGEDPFEVVPINEYEIDIHKIPNEWGEKEIINDSLIMLKKNNQAHILYKRKNKKNWQGVDFPEVDSVQFVELNQKGSQGVVIHQTHREDGSGGTTSTSFVTILDISAQPTFIFYAQSGCAVQAFGRYESPAYYTETRLPISLKGGIITIGNISSNEDWAENGYDCDVGRINPGKYEYVDGGIKPIIK